MTIQDDELARKVAGYLDQGTAAMRAGTAYRLQLARQQALAHLTAAAQATEPELAGASAGGVGMLRPGGTGGRGLATHARIWMGVGLLAAATLGYQQYQDWQALQQTTEIVETDAAILTSELPIDAYLDRGFQNWLKHLDEK
ncbi:MAG: DUF3619 family protein [Casimicrobiaceae bacterium]